MIIIVVLIISMNIIVIITRKYQKWWWWRESQPFALLKRDSKQSSSFEQTEQDLPKSRHCKILLQAGPRPDKPEFTRKSIRLKKLFNNHPFFHFHCKKMSPLLFPNLVSYRDFNSNWRFLHLDNYLRKWKQVAKHILRLWVSSICVLQWVWKMSFHRKKDKIYNSGW